MCSGGRDRGRALWLRHARLALWHGRERRQSRVDVGAGRDWPLLLAPRRPVNALNPASPANHAHNPVRGVRGQELRERRAYRACVRPRADEARSQQAVFSRPACSRIASAY